MTFEIYKAADAPGGQKGQWRWRLRHSNKNIVATSGEGYVDKAECRTMIEHIQANCPKAPIKEV